MAKKNKWLLVWKHIMRKFKNKNQYISLPLPKSRKNKNLVRKKLHGKSWLNLIYKHDLKSFQIYSVLAAQENSMKEPLKIISNFVRQNLIWFKNRKNGNSFLRSSKLNQIAQLFKEKIVYNHLYNSLKQFPNGIMK